MYIHSVNEGVLGILDWIRHNRHTFRNSDRSERRFQQYLHDIADSEVYYFDEIDHLVTAFNKQDEISGFGSMIKPPFYKVVFEGFTYDENRNTSALMTTRFAFLMITKLDRYEISIFEQPDKNDPWVSTPQYIVIDKPDEKSKPPEDSTVLSIDNQEGVHVIVHNEHYDNMETDVDDFNDNVVHHARKTLVILKALMLIIACKNVITEVKQPSKVLNRMRARKKKPLMKPYNIFKVVRNNKPKQNGRKIKGKSISESKELTHCPGHFKTYTDDKPLFGKHVGTWWWSPWIKEGYEDQYRERRVEVKR